MDIGGLNLHKTQIKNQMIQSLGDHLNALFTFQIIWVYITFEIYQINEKNVWLYSKMGFEVH